ncbi:MAG: hypothetical protein RJB10_776 [Pseudomonadota bacterium]|jgi:hypothetical protein
MKNHLKISSLCLALCLFTPLAAYSQFAPGEDPIHLTKLSKTELRPTAPQQVSGSLDPLFGMQGWLRARVTRYEARAYSDNGTENLLTDNDAVTTASAQGLNKVCVQEVGSSASTTTGFGKYGPKGGAQIVVLKGDLVNICK